MTFIYPNKFSDLDEDSWGNVHNIFPLDLAPTPPVLLLQLKFVLMHEYFLSDGNP